MNFFLKNNKKKFRNNFISGFTLIELLVVISIIGLLSSVVLASLNTARAKARDAKRIAEIRQLYTALESYYAQTGSTLTGNSGHNASTVGGNTGGCNNATSGSPHQSWGVFLQPLVNVGLLSQIPSDPLNDSNYCYFHTRYSPTAGDWHCSMDLNNISPIRDYEYAISFRSEATNFNLPRRGGGVSTGNYSWSGAGDWYCILGSKR